MLGKVAAVLTITNDARKLIENKICVIWSQTRIRKTAMQHIVPGKTQVKILMNKVQVGELRIIEEVKLILNPDDEKHPGSRLIRNFMNPYKKGSAKMLFRFELMPIKTQKSKCRRCLKNK